jgi:hypothetical protein
MVIFHERNGWAVSLESKDQYQMEKHIPNNIINRLKHLPVA